MDFKMKKQTFGIVAAVCVVLLCLGVYGLIQEYSFVEGAVSVNSYVPWGLFISLFLFLEAVGAGTLVFAALGKFSSAARMKLALVGVVGTACGGLAILPDVGNPLQAWRLFFTPNPTSPLMLDVWLMVASLVFGVLLFFGLRFDKGGLEKVGKWGSAVFASLLVLGTAIMFCSLAGKVGWESTSEFGIALIQGYMAGSCVVLLLVAKLSEEQTAKIAKFAGILLVFNLIMIFAEALLVAYRDDYAFKAFEAMMFGRYAVMFWIQVIVGIVVPAAMFLANKSVKIAAIIAILGLALSKYLFVMRGSVYPTYGEISPGAYIPILAPGEGAQMVQTYIPTMNEWFVAGAVLGLAVLAVVVIYNTKLVKAEDAE